MSRLFLVDGMSHIYRAYYAIQGLTNKKGLSTNAVYGFTTMLRKLIGEEKPDYLGVAIDLFGPTVRHEAFEEYKATRRKMPEDLIEQIPYIRSICEALRVPVLSMEKYEADDVIGTLSMKAREAGVEVVIVTIDKDLFQLVNDDISVFDTRSMTRYGRKEVEQKMGVRPDQIVDLLSLVGDSSDNIPGAPGIGKVGAAKLISEYGDLETLLKNKDEVSRKTYRESLQQNEALIRQSRELLRVHCDLDLPLDLELLRLDEPDPAKLQELFLELGFTTLLDEMPAIEPEERQLELTVVKDARSLETLLARCRGKEVAVAAWVDQDPSGGCSLGGIAVSLDARSASFVRGELLKGVPRLTEKLFAPEATWIFHDLKSTYLALPEAAWDFSENLADTMLMGYLMSPNENDFSLSRMSREYLNRELGEAAREPSLLANALPEQLGEQAAVTVELYRRIRPDLEAQGLEKLLFEVEIPLVVVLAEMEREGVRVDVGQLQEMSEQAQEQIERIAAEIFESAGEEFNLNSPKQLSYVLFEKLNLPTSKKTGKAGHYSTGVEVLDELSESFDIARLILEYRELAKLKSTYLDALPRLIHPKTGRIHTCYNQMVASTGRLSSSNPNLQNIPIRSEIGRQIRRAFVPREGFSILAADYSQIELRVMAHLSGDPVLTDAFKRGQDIHQRTAEEVFGKAALEDPREMRRRAKVINFGIMYGLSPFGLARSLKIGRAEAQQFIDEYFERYQGVKSWTEKIVEEARERGHVTTLFGRIRQIPEIKSKNWSIREFGRRTAVNAPIQGTAADLIKMAMVSIHRRIGEEGLRSRLILQVHDELVFEVADPEIGPMEALVQEEMEGVFELAVPLKVDLAVGRSWYEAK